jgi:hypothetical protein
MPINSWLLHPPTNGASFAGSIDPAFLFFDGATSHDIERGAGLPLREAERHRLVEAAKSPTQKKYEKFAEKIAKTRFFSFQPAPELASEFVGPLDAIETKYREVKAAEQLRLVEEFREKNIDVVGSKTIIQFREWSSEWRIRTQVDGTVGTAPPSQAGLRISKMLSTGGARKIADSCAYMAATRGGFKTFVTGTFNEEARARIASGETSIQREVTRCMDALTKMYSRGWRKENGEEVAGYGESLPYCWVVEVPKNESGENNPHVHMLLDWEVAYCNFREWATRIESIWGNGYFHLEKIDDPLCAGAYMAKAAGYLTKAAGMSDQGEVSGNRYAISKAARAPSWQTIGTYQLGIMGHLIREVYDSIQAKHSEKFIERHKLREERERVRALAKKAQASSAENRYPLWAKQRLEDIGAKLCEVRNHINSMPVRASKYQLVIKNESHFEKFIAWAAAHGWHWLERPPSHWLAKFRTKLYARKTFRNAASWFESKVSQVTDALDLQAWGEWAAIGVRG